MGCTTVAVTAEPDGVVNPDLKKYCMNIAAAAADSRFAWQTNKLKDLDERVKKRVRELDAKEAELKDWLDKRQAIEKEANDKLVGIYAKMRPETAALQISSLSDDMAAAVLGQLTPRQASAIFNEIGNNERAAKLAAMIAGVPPTDDKKL